jgi:hypothetical protein
MKLMMNLVARTALPLGLGMVIVILAANLSRLFLSSAPASTGVEQIVIDSQRLAATNQQPCDLLLVGDSSCLMNIAADQLTSLNPGRSAYNLGMVSIIPLAHFGQLIADHSAINADSPRFAVLLIHPEMLGLESSLTNLEAQQDRKSPASLRLKMLRTSGFVPSFERSFARIIPEPLPGKYRDFYGFTATLRKYLADHHGSAIDPSSGGFRSLQPPHLIISESFRRDAQTFRRLIPDHTRLLIGLSPVPESVVSKEFTILHETFLKEFAELLKPDGILQLPNNLPDIFFATPTHLRAEYRSSYTRFFNQELNRVISSEEITSDLHAR